MQQLILFTEAKSASSPASPALTQLPSTSDPENPHILAALANGYWTDVLALIHYRAELHQRIKAEMILAVADRSSDLGEVREAVREVTGRISDLLEGPLDNEHIERIRHMPAWNDFDQLQSLHVGIQHDLNGMSKTSKAVAADAVVIIAAKLSLLRRQLH